ncbi:hypothetical protein [Paenibacillus flagellatus]|uniref:DUF624 domain-containing protein n=1 Tax=Paenibacillus flagellatus TaxID=2211139 RepID=A0A2V5KFD8_9BACL|nr:hypothetical protein [Paenibacillus flagellatus]PYI57144.1 hypothetical protein DLM86_01500 [Paenibacillus flagellatus]
MRKLSEIVVRSAKRIYQDIIPVALFSMTGAIVFVPFVFFLPIGISLVFLPFVAVPLAAGALHATHRMMKGEKPRLAAMFAGVWKFALPSIAFAFVCSIFILIIVSTWWYYGGKSGMLYFVLAVFQTYFVSMVLVSQLYALPLVVQEGAGVFTAMGRSVKLFLAHPVYTIGAFVQLLSLTVLLGVTVIGFAALYLGMYGIYANEVTANVLAKPERDDEDGGRPADEARTDRAAGRDRFETASALGN